MANRLTWRDANVQKRASVLPNASTPINAGREFVEVPTIETI